MLMYPWHPPARTLSNYDYLRLCATVYDMAECTATAVSTRLDDLVIPICDAVMVSLRAARLVHGLSEERLHEVVDCNLRRHLLRANLWTRQTCGDVMRRILSEIE
jgi:hypothetical protein